MSWTSKREDEIARASEALEELRADLARGNQTGLKRRLFEQLTAVERVRDEACDCLALLKDADLDHVAELAECRQAGREQHGQMGLLQAEIESLSDRLADSEREKSKLQRVVDKTREYIRNSAGSRALFGYDEFMRLNGRGGPA